jgi:DNA-binding transcriptional MerR regulator
VSDRPYLSIGDVLTLLRQEFPDVTISKIRFLESQGLVNPERTPSGYRKFYEPDVERLRWVLRQQREHFLPLKVIKGRLEEVVEGRLEEVGDRQGNGRSHAGVATAAPREEAPAPPTGSSDPKWRPGRPAPSLPGMAAAGATAPSPRPDRAPAPAAAARRGDGPAAAPAPARARRADPAPPEAPETPAVLAEGDMTGEELAAAAGTSPERLATLESYGLVGSRTVGGVRYYGEEALVVARLAQAFAGFGVEPRHLRLHKHAADREAGFIEQVVLPLLKQRNPESRRRAHETVKELSRLGQELRAVLLARVLRDHLGG